MDIIQSRPLLVVEDSDEDFEALGWAFESAALTNPVYRCTTGDDALDFLHQNGKYNAEQVMPSPALILLDLNLPGTDGREVLEEIKQDTNLKTIPVVVLSTSSNPKDIESCYQKGANTYLVKPVDFDQFMKQIQVFCRYWFEAAIIPESGGI
jgi:CheY-like chemotaxis protein